MPFIEWSDDLSVGIEEIDQQHSSLVDIVNELDEAMRQGRGTRIMSAILGRLTSYTQEHFACEETLMEQHGYDGLQLHRSQHRQLLEKVQHFGRQSATGEMRITRDVMEFLKYWLCSHIMKEDIAFGETIRQEVPA